MLNPFKLLDRTPKPDPAQMEITGFARDPFAAVPHRNELAEARTDSDSCVQIRLRLKPIKKMAAFMANTLGFHRDVRVDLDPRGSYFWSQVDGRRDLRAIEKKIRKKFDLEAEESRKATLMFTKMLMLRHLILLDLGDRQPEEEQPATEATRHVG